MEPLGELVVFLLAIIFLGAAGEALLDIGGAILRFVARAIYNDYKEVGK